jgi:hypothetical protein
MLVSFENTLPQEELLGQTLGMMLVQRLKPPAMGNHIQHTTRINKKCIGLGICCLGRWWQWHHIKTNPELLTSALKKNGACIMPGSIKGIIPGIIMLPGTWL